MLRGMLGMELTHAGNFNSFELLLPQLIKLCRVFRSYPLGK
jgi:hypothetical protein